MAKAFKRLTAAGVKAETKPGRYHDGDGLYLRISNSGSKSWQFRYTRDGKAHWMGIGSVKTIGLSEARKAVHEFHQQIQSRQDPLALRGRLRRLQKAESDKALTFREVADRYIASKGGAWNNKKHAQQWPSTLERYVYPIVGDMRVDEIEQTDILRVLEPIWHDKTETASRVRGRLENILDYATVYGYRRGDNPAVWRGRLDKVLPRRSELEKQVKNFPSLPYSQIGEFVEQLKARSGTAALALEFLILTAARSGEARGARWDEINLDQKIWTIPARRMKANREHRVPLSRRATQILREAAKGATSEFVFPSSNGNPLSEGAFRSLLKRMDYSHVTTHGFRASFKDWALEQTAFQVPEIEMALAHSLKPLEKAYQRGDLALKRGKLMDAWARFCATPSNKKADNITPIRAAR